MAATMKELGIDRLSVEERLALVQEIWDSIVATPELPGLSEQQKHLFEQRMAELDANPGDVLTWDEIRRDVQGQGRA